MTVDVYGHLVPGANRQAVDPGSTVQPDVTSTQPIGARGRPDRRNRAELGRALSTSSRSFEKVRGPPRLEPSPATFAGRRHVKSSRPLGVASFPVWNRSGEAWSVQIQRLFICDAHMFNPRRSVAHD